MTKKQVISSLRERIEHALAVSDRDLAECSKLCEDRSYYIGCIDAYNLVLEILCDYD